MESDATASTGFESRQRCNTNRTSPKGDAAMTLGELIAALQKVSDEWGPDLDVMMHLWAGEHVDWVEGVGVETYDDRRWVTLKVAP